MKKRLLRIIVALLFFSTLIITIPTLLTYWVFTGKEYFDKIFSYIFVGE